MNFFYRRNDSGTIWKATCGFAIPYAFAQVFGKALYRTNSLSAELSSAGKCAAFAGRIVLIAAITAVIVYAILILILSFNSSISHKITVKSDWWMWPVMFLCWVPCYLAYYPGVFSYDIITQTKMIMENNVTAAVPPLHTLIWYFFLTLDHATNSKVIAIVWYSILQMLAFSAMLSNVVAYIKRLTLSRIWTAVSFLFFALNPIIALMSFMTTKAVLFSGCFSLVAVRLWELAKDPVAFLQSRKKTLGLGVWILLASLFRSNAVFSFLLVIPFVLFSFGEYRWKAASVLAVPVATYILITTAGYHLLGIDGVGKNELFCIPFQQIACVYSRHDDELSTETKILTNAFTESDTLAERYNPRFSDPVKNTFIISSDQAFDFLKLWLTLGIKYPWDYLDAFLTLNLPYWYPEADSVDEFAKRDYIETATGGYGYYWVFPSSKIPYIKSFYDKVADFSLFRNIPLIRKLFSISVPVWIMTFSLTIFSVKKAKKYKLLIFPSFFQWLIFIFGPVSNLRYIFPIIILYPVFLSSSLSLSSYENLKENR